MRIGIVAGESSGDLLGANLIQALRQQIPDVEVVGVGGPAMIAAGFHSLHDIERLSVMGLVEPLFHLRDLFKLRHDLYTYFTENKPDIFIGIDAPDFNLGLERKLRDQHIPIVHYVSPSVWAWRQKRIFKIQKSVDLMLTLFPFETAIYQQHQIPVEFVGHPLAEKIPLEIDQVAAREQLGLACNARYIAILPGSRKQEIKYMAETFLQAANLCREANADLQFITSVVNEQHAERLKQICAEQFPDLPLAIFVGQSHSVMAAANVILVTSGTATLEAMLHKRPLVIAYKMSPITFQLAKYLVKTPYIGLPNLLAGKKLAPEFIQHAANPRALADAIMHYLHQPEECAQLQKEFYAMHEKLRTEAKSPAAAILKLHCTVPQSEPRTYVRGSD